MQPRNHRRLVWIVLALIAVSIGGVGAFLILSSTSSTPPVEEAPAKTVISIDTKKLACVEALPDDILIGQKLMAAIYAEYLNAQQPIVAGLQLGGVILMNETDASSIASLSTGLSITPIIATDQEGGTVQRFKSQGKLAGAQEIADSLTATQAYGVYLADSEYLASLGVTTNFAPVVDVISADPNPLPGRMYSSSPNLVSSYAGQFILAQKHAGITPVIKHFPGLGSASGNTDFGPATTDPIETLKTRDLLPYEALSSLDPDVMVGNAIIPGLTDGQPATWSKAAIDLLRDYGYERSVVYSDSLTAQAIPGTLKEAVLKTWQAGVDVALIVESREQVYSMYGDLQEIIDYAKTALADGQLERSMLAESVLRIVERKSVDPCTIGGQ